MSDADKVRPISATAPARTGEDEIMRIVANAKVIGFPGAQDGGGGGPGGKGPTLVGPSDGDPNDLELASRLPNDIGNSQRLRVRYGRDLMSVDETGWRTWDGRRWSAEAGQAEALKLAHLTAVAIHSEADALEEVARVEIAELLANAPAPEVDSSTLSPAETEIRRGALGDHKEALKNTRAYWKCRLAAYRKFANASGNKPKLDGILSQAEPYLRVPPRDLDAQPFLLNVENGTLEIGEPDHEGSVPVSLCNHERSDKISRLAPVSYDPEATAPEYMKFLETIEPDPEIRGFWQRFFGYCLTGDISEQIIVVAHGKGANGKSTLLEVISEVIGDYAVTVPVSTFLFNDRQGGGDATPDLARLPGVRLVLASEPEIGARFSESVIKSITGGERMAVRHLFKNPFEFMPCFKLVISCNTKPYIRGADDGIWRRLLIVPFSITIPKDERENQAVLKGRLLAERSGILNWMLDGVRMWREGGLNPPSAIVEATEEYRADVNPISAFMKECTQEQEWEKVQSSHLHRDYCRWAEAQGLEPLKLAKFGRRLGDMGYRKERGANVFYVGICMKSGWDDGLEQPGNG